LSAFSLSLYFSISRSLSLKFVPFVFVFLSLSLSLSLSLFAFLCSSLAVGSRPWSEDWIAKFDRLHVSENVQAVRALQGFGDHLAQDHKIMIFFICCCVTGGHGLDLACSCAALFQTLLPAKGVFVR
jgi:hypothetical protein